MFRLNSTCRILFASGAMLLLPAVSAAAAPKASDVIKTYADIALAPVLDRKSVV